MIGYWGYGAGFGLINLFFWVLFAWFIVRLFHHGHGGWHRGYHGHYDHGADNRSAIDYLKERYAKGEIDKAEYDRVRKDLGE